MCDAEFHYTYEYQGNAAKLVHTPLTDKCYLTLTQGMHMGLGGNPYGPAGTGKTESVKALGGLFGRQVLVFNCDEVGIKNMSQFQIILSLICSTFSFTMKPKRHELYLCDSIHHHYLVAFKCANNLMML